MTTTLLRPLSVGEILDGGFTIYRQYFMQLMSMGLMLYGPPAVLGIVAALIGDSGTQAVVSLVYQLANGLAGITLIGAYVWMASEIVLGRAPNTNQALGMGLRKFFPVLITAIVVSICTTLACMCLIVPGIIVWIILFAAIPVVVLENRWDFFKRSPELAKESWGKIAIVVILYSLIIFLPSMILGVGVALSQGLDPVQSSVTPIWGVLATLIVSALTASFGQICLTLLYYDQRVRKEGFDVEYTTSQIGSGSGGAGA